jgi:hypothetical protein
VVSIRGGELAFTITVRHLEMSHPLAIEGTRICVLVHPDEVVICANIEGFKALGMWMAWLAESKPEEFYHFHLLLHLESEASRFEGTFPKNILILRTPSTHETKSTPLEGMELVAFEMTFQVLTESALDELAAAQVSGLIPSKYLRSEPSYVGACG